MRTTDLDTLRNSQPLIVSLFLEGSTVQEIVERLVNLTVLDSTLYTPNERCEIVEHQIRRWLQAKTHLNFQKYY